MQFHYSLDLQFFAGEKTEKATPKKRQDVRKKGQTAKSQDLITAFILLAVFFVLLFTGPKMLDQFFTIFHQTFEVYMHQDVTVNSISQIALELFQELLMLLAPVMIAALVGAVLANYLQVGFMFTPESLKVKLEKLDPIKGAKRIFSIRAIVELLKSLLKVSIIGGIVFAILWFNMNDLLGLMNIAIGSSFALIASITVKLGLFASGGLLFLSLFDYLYQKYDFEKSIRMSKQDIKEENKSMEGDPLIRSRIRQRQREMAMRRMMQEVPNADVVITNPTHYAIALKYDENKMDAPYVLAKGVDFIAQKIKLIAKEHDVIMVENRPLARGLYDQAEIGDAIPEEFFKAVAEILAYVYRVQKKI
ncbi:flagellar biosynthesis protein FlhB [Caldibacillus lycopersici]|uniref:Flagellar biosynthetic protein FlhB n=1 Tax=Perspicuibacillus lycopersici TaxID=1325689 RepID=A0AAE3LRU0_9BACI|nr:flagellar biosynthesis protein FlhB [Perspicuibacillus lycopersici]MCU9612088.1 flagellar biosynthesis protein FlhB [Perspicuibacillus lycopersici]